MQDKIEETKVETIFYADDGLLGSFNPTQLQSAIDILTDLFAQVGLKMNPTKTKAMTTKGGKMMIKQSQEPYNHRVTGIGESYQEQKA